MEECKRIVLVAALTSLILFCLGSVAIAQTVNNFIFEQLNFLNQDGIMVANNSDWGQVSFDIVPASDGVVRYLNISATIEGDTGWIVRNYPVLPDEFIDAGRFGLHFDLNEIGITSGEDAVTLEYVADVTDNIRFEGPGGFMTSASIYDLDVERFGSLIPGGDNDYDGPDTLVPAYYTSEVDKEQLRKYKGIPEVQEGRRECAAGSTARSLKWLSDKHNLGLGNAQAIKNALADAGYMNQGVTDEDQVKAKKRYIDDNNLPLEVHYWYSKTVYPTGINTPGIPSEHSQQIDLIDYLWREMGKGQDIEITFRFATGHGHSVTLAGIDKKNKMIEYRDDEAQGDDNNGDKALKETKLVPLGAGEYGFDARGDRIKCAIVESPVKQAQMTATPETAPVGTPATITVKNTGSVPIHITNVDVHRPSCQHDNRDVDVVLQPGEEVSWEYPEFWQPQNPNANVDEVGEYTVRATHDKGVIETIFERYAGLIPTLTEWGLIIFGLVLLGFITWVFLRKRKVAVT